MPRCPMRSMGISGSLCEASTNTSVLQAIAQIAPPGVAAVMYRGLGTLPCSTPTSTTPCRLRR